MRRWGTWGLLVGLVTLVAAAGRAEPVRRPPTWAPRDAASKPKNDYAQADKQAKPSAAPVKDARAAEAKADLPPARPSTIIDEVASERERELEALFRRQMVCLKLMDIALQTGDDELLRKAEQLDERARQLYTQRTAHMPGSRAGSFDSDEQILERHLGPTDTAIRRAPDRSEGKMPPGWPSSAHARRGEEEP